MHVNSYNLTFLQNISDLKVKRKTRKHCMKLQGLWLAKITIQNSLSALQENHGFNLLEIQKGDFGA